MTVGNQSISEGPAPGQTSEEAAKLARGPSCCDQAEAAIQLQPEQEAISRKELKLLTELSWEDETAAIPQGNGVTHAVRVDETFRVATVLDCNCSKIRARSTGNLIGQSMSEKYRPYPFYNGVSTFKTAFPTLGDAVVEWRERRGPEDPKSGDVRKTGYRRGNFTQGLLLCSNPNCCEGGYQIDRVIAEMLQLGETEREGMLLCSGREMGDETRRGPIRCPHRIEYKITLTPRTEGQRPERPQPRRRGRNRYPRRNSAA